MLIKSSFLQLITSALVSTKWGYPDLESWCFKGVEFLAMLFLAFEYVNPPRNFKVRWSRNANQVTQKPTKKGCCHESRLWYNDWHLVQNVSTHLKWGWFWGETKRTKIFKFSISCAAENFTSGCFHLHVDFSPNCVRLQSSCLPSFCIDNQCDRKIRTSCAFTHRCREWPFFVQRHISLIV